MSYDFSFILSEEDYFQFNKHHMLHGEQNRKQLMLTRFLFPFIYMVFGAVFGYTLSNPAIAFIVFGIISALWIIFFNSIMVQLLKRNIKRLKKSGKLIYDKEIHMLFGDETFSEQTQDSKSDYFYTIIERIEIGDTAVYMYTGAAAAHIVPYRVFPDEDTKNGFIEFIMSRLNHDISL